MEGKRQERRHKRPLFFFLFTSQISTTQGWLGSYTVGGGGGDRDRGGGLKCTFRQGGWNGHQFPNAVSRRSNIKFATSKKRDFFVKSIVASRAAFFVVPTSISCTQARRGNGRRRRRRPTAAAACLTEEEGGGGGGRPSVRTHMRPPPLIPFSACLRWWGFWQLKRRGRRGRTRS